MKYALPNLMATVWSLAYMAFRPEALDVHVLAHTKGWVLFVLCLFQFQFKSG